MENTTVTKTMQSPRVRFAFPQVADRSLVGHNHVVRLLAVDSRNVGVGKAFQGTGLSKYGFDANGGPRADLWISTATRATSFHSPMHKAVAVKDVAYLRSWRPPV